MRLRKGLWAVGKNLVVCVLPLATKKGDSKEVLDHECSFSMSQSSPVCQRHILNDIQVGALSLDFSGSHIEISSFKISFD